MTNQFHRTLNIMAVFVTGLAVLLGFFHTQFMELTSTNYVINGIIIGTGLFGIGLCFYEMFCLLPEYRWLSNYIHGHRNLALPPYILRQIALVLQQRPCRIYSGTLSGLMDMVADRFATARESIRYIINTLILLGLLGTFWGLLTTLGSFQELTSGLNPTDMDMINSIKAGLSGPLSGMAIAFTSSLLGLGASLIVGFLGHMVSLAQNAIYTELGDYMANHTHTSCPDTQVLPKIDLNTKKISATIAKTHRNKPRAED